MYVSEDKLIENLENIRNKLEENNILTDEDSLTISILIGHLEELKNKEE